MPFLTSPLGFSFSGSTNFTSQSELEAAVSVAGSWAGLSHFIVAGLQITTVEGDDLFRVAKYVGAQNIPSDIKRLRRSVYETMRRFGQPVIVKHMFNDADNKFGLAEPSPNFQPAYGQTRNRDPLSHGIGFVSREKSEDEWIAPDGTIVQSVTQPGSDFIPAPKYRGYGPGYLTYIIEPDAAQDVYLPSEEGVFIRVQQAQAQTAWFPEINDNDLIINVTLDKEGRITTSGERYQAKQTNPITIRGLDRRGRREYSGDDGNRHMVNQNFEMSLVPVNNVLYNVEVDR